MKPIIKLFSLVAVMLSASLAYGEILPPDWRGLESTTYQVWNFASDATVVSPDTAVNSYGDAQASVSLGWAATGHWESYPPIAGGRLGVWDIGRGIDPVNPAIGRITIDLPVFPTGGGEGTYVDVWVQVVYYKDITDAPDVEVLGGSKLSELSQVVETIPVWGSWYVSQSAWRVSPLASSVTINITGNYMGSMIDQVVVDSQAVPEPATMTLLGVGLSALILRRRKLKVMGR